MALKIQEIKNPRSCLNKAGVDEPIFVLRANDELAPDIVEIWADRYEFTKKRAGKWTPEAKLKCAEARVLCKQMRDWKTAPGEADAKK